MRFFIALTYCLLAYCTLVGQNWRLCDPGREYYYGLNNVYECLRIDSVAVVSTDSIYFPSRRLTFDPSLHPDTCASFIESFSRFGEKILFNGTGDYRFVEQGDTFLLKTRPTGPWIARTDPPETWLGPVNALSFAYDTGTVFGVQDSILTIVLQHMYSGIYYLQEVRIAKTFGLLDMPALFGEHHNYSFNDSLRGMTHPSFGVTNLPKERFFTMQPGDTIQIFQEYYNGWSEWWNTYYFQDIYLQRWQSTMGDTLFFQIDRTTISYYNHQGIGCTRQIVVDTIPWLDAGYQRLDRKFGEVWTPDWNHSDWVANWRFDPDFPNRLQKPSNVTDHWVAADTCLHNIRWTLGGQQDEYYMDGMGGPYYSVQAFSWSEDMHAFRYPIYARLGGTAEGNPMDFDSMYALVAAPPPIAPLPEISIFPNPATHAVTIDLRKWISVGKLTVEVCDAAGQIIDHKFVQCGENFSLDILHYPAGLFLLRISDQHSQVTKRFVKQ
jgi:hypothetical protein